MITNFGNYIGDGFINLELQIKNPGTPKFTSYWACKTYSDRTDTSLIIESNGNARG
jgi:hypothetical protein